MEGNKPYITYVANDFVLPVHLQKSIINDLPSEGIEWQPTYGRQKKMVYVEAEMIPFSEEHLKIPTSRKPADQGHNLLRLPLLHTFWIETTDQSNPEQFYKNTNREELNQWINKMLQNRINSWLVVVLEPQDKRSLKSNQIKLALSTRTSAVDRVKVDFPSSVKNIGEHCIGLTDPNAAQTTGKDRELYQNFLRILRHWLLSSFSEHLKDFEQFVRSERERRTATDWNFFEFFFLQEQLAFALETLSLYDEALVHYDELDALFSQFVINSNVGEMPEWLKQLSEECDNWNGLCLAKDHSRQLRNRLQTTKPSLLDLRNYLFARQCELLLLHNRPWELASRSLPFLQNCVNELKLLEISLPEGAIACWVYLSAIEILQTCERYSDSSQMETYSRHTVELWAYGRKKMEELGALCGLMPDMKHTSECLHRVVSLIAGIGEDFYADREDPLSPQRKLKDSLAKPDNFLKSYLEMSEITMGTYKHIGRLRYARLIGLELALIYMKMSKHQQALPFLTDLEKVYLTEKWPILLTDIRRLIFECYDILDDSKKKLKYAALLAASTELPEAARASYMSDCIALKETLTTSATTDQASKSAPVIYRMEEIFPVKSVRLLPLDSTSGMIVTNSPVHMELTIENRLPKPITAHQLAITMKIEPVKAAPKGKVLGRHQSDQCVHHTLSADPKSSAPPNDPYHSPPKVPLELRTYHTQQTIGIKCPNIARVLKRSDSHGLFLLDKDPTRDPSEAQFTAHDVLIEPGLNKIQLSFEPRRPLCHILHQVVLSWTEQLEFLATRLPSHVCFGVISEDPSLKVVRLTTLEQGQSSELLSGIRQSIVLELNAGTARFEQNQTLTIRASRELKIKLETDIDGPLREEVSIKLPAPLKPFDTFTIPLTIKARLCNQRDGSSTEHQLTLTTHHPDQDPLQPSIKPISTSVNLIPPFMTALRLHTCGQRKFCEILVHGCTRKNFELFKPSLDIFGNNDPTPSDLFKLLGNDSTKLATTKDQTVHLLWEFLNQESSTGSNPLNSSKVTLKFSYRSLEEHDNEPISTELDSGKSKATELEQYECDFRLSNYSTLFTIRAQVEPQKGFEFCRVGTLCSLKVTIERVCNERDACAVMYEVIGDSQIWSVTGRSAGVIDATQAAATRSVLNFDVLPLSSGFLPLPTVRVSKYITAGGAGNHPPTAPTADRSPQSLDSSEHRRGSLDAAAANIVTEAKLVAFDVGQVYNCSRAAQVHVLPSSGLIHAE